MEQASVWDFCPQSAELWTYKQDREVTGKTFNLPFIRGETSDVFLQQLNILHVTEKDVKTEVIVPATSDEPQLWIAVHD